MSALVEVIPQKNNNLILFSYAGSFIQSLVSIKTIIPDNYGLFLADYNDVEVDELLSSNKSFETLARFYANILNKFQFSNCTMFGISFGGYLVFRISQILYLQTMQIPNKIVLSSVMDIPHLLKFITQPQHQQKYFQDLYNSIDIAPDIRTEINKLILKDITILKTFQVDEKFKLPTDVTIINGIYDNLCNKHCSLKYWSQLFNGKTSISYYKRGHVPTHHEIKRIIATII